MSPTGTQSLWEIFGILNFALSGNCFSILLMRELSLVWTMIMMTVMINPNSTLSRVKSEVMESMSWI